MATKHAVTRSGKALRVFQYHGATLLDPDDTSEEVLAGCPFCGKDKFYVNQNKIVWHCKVCGEGGNINRFLDLISKEYEKEFHHNRRRALAKDRNLPEEAFDYWRFGWNGKDFTFPVIDINGIVIDVKTYRKGSGHVKASPGGILGLFGAEHLKARPGERVFVCEGEWDAIALHWLLRNLKKKGVVVAVPGADNFKWDWVPWFQDRRVYTIYDADPPGERGELKAKDRLSQSAKEVYFMHWPPGLENGYDARDWICWGIDHEVPKKCYFSMMRNFKGRPRAGFGEPAKKTLNDFSSGNPVVDEEVEPKTLKEVKHTFHNWLELENSDGIEVMLATVVSHHLEGDPLWMFLVAPPGGAKTELLNSMMEYDGAYLLSSLTPKTLISGMNYGAGKDPSLLPKLDGKILIVKDFTAILTIRDNDKDEIFGTLRDVYDGHCRKSFGNGVTRTYRSRFTFLAAVTPKIYEISHHHAALGERFLKYFVGDNLRHFNEEETIRKAIGNVGFEVEMREEISRTVRGFLENLEIPEEPPSMDLNIVNRIISLSQFLARMRGTVVRDAYRVDLVVGKPSREHGTRISKQLTKLAKSLAILHGKDAVGLPEYRILKKVAVDTAAQRRVDIVEAIWKNTKTVDDIISAREIQRITKYPLATVARLLADLDILEVTRRAGGKRGVYQLTPEFRDVISVCKVFESKKVKTRVRLGRRFSQTPGSTVLLS
jgi:hypothetical protein